MSSDGENERVEENHDGKTCNGETENNDKIIDDVSEASVLKHPLQNSWCLWFYKHDRQKDWTDNLKMVTTFTFVEDFWALFNHIQPASKLPAGCDYCLFKEGIQPKWEDKSNKLGGRWLISLDKSDRHSQLDKCWTEILLLLIGEAFDDDSDEICGTVVNIRAKGDKLSIWTGDGMNKSAVLNIGRKIKERLNIPANVTIAYQSHAEQQSRQSSTARAQYSV